MSQRKGIPIFIGLALLLFFFLPFPVAGFSNIRQAENAAREGEFSAASEAYARASRFLFWRGDLREKAGIAAAQGGSFLRAISYLEAAPSLSEAGWMWLGVSHFELGDASSAIGAFENGLRHYKSPALYRLLASVQRSQRNWQAERLALENQLQLDSSDPYAHYRLGLLLMLFASDQALDELNRASSLNPEVDSAVQTLRSALAVSSTQPDDAHKMLTIGRAFGLVQEWELAFTAFEQSVGLDPRLAEAWAWLGEAKQQLGQDGRAELDKALSLGRTSASVRALRALYWARQERYPQVLAEYLLAAEFDPQNPAWRAGIADAYVKLGDLSAALTAYQHAADLSPNEATYWRLLAVFCAENGIHIEDVAIPAAQKAVTFAPNDPSSLDALGVAYFSSSRYASAEQAFLQALEFDPGYFPAHIHLGMNFLAQGNRTDAFNSLTYVRDSDAGLYRETALRLLAQYFP